MEDKQESNMYDVVVFGATSFVGTLVARYVANHAPQGVSFALAGRNEQKLQSLGIDAPLIVADASDAEDMRRLAESARVVITTVGPYDLYGRTLVRACAEAGTDYLDLAGEVNFVRDSILTLDETARKSGARIVHSAGFDSIPSDIALFRLHQKQGSLGTTRMVVEDLVGGISGGTVASALNAREHVAQLDEEKRAALRSPFALAPGARSTKKVRSTGATGDLAPFFMAGYNTRLVQRSAQLLDYGPEFAYSEYRRVGSRWRSLITTARLKVFGWLTSTHLGRRLASRFLPAPGEGPSAEERARGRFKIKTTDQESVRVELDMDPGYEGTALMIAESAFSLLEHEGDAGVTTPAAALGDTLVERLRAAGMRIS
ncbi:hypothetical protein C3B44_09050 [Corynebacterium yudongzhengii]|uniref:Saccharopine dehydrogenase NADP binding domain-containing protein n=1 Tax=Corynebacterium yudongzhengii TaxID=2080740 RepID=A0A2U1T961_9CORY|nr:saccharopine dehydrogenase NADP-binding domain-containing protein [Corynebacterium yudongzhengii]AWB83025.1 hypothetical protein C3B44_09050 [Corynebacterium yudongzhengii]PWC02522.1 hypothetical protein DF222_02220 [Corynebacterium yudongzhengii]